MFKLFKKKEKVDGNDLIDYDSMYTVVEKLGIRGYKAAHLNTCRKTWKEQVPERGQADSLQGELLRQLEKLRNEALGNGNINWDDNFAWFCDFIVRTLQESKLFEEKHMDTITGAVGYIKECGEYARRYWNGEISDEEANPMLFAYVDHDLYDYIADAIAIFAEKNPKPVYYEKKFSFTDEERGSAQMKRIEFKYHPNLYHDEVLIRSEGVCNCCGKTVSEYIGMAYSTEELFHRTPGYVSWQGENWLACCDDYCAYLGAVGIKELETMGIKEEALRDYAAQEITYPMDVVEQYLRKDGDLCGYLFRCLHCGRYRLYVDAS